MSSPTEAEYQQRYNRDKTFQTNIRIYKSTTVLEESLKRIRWVFERFDTVIVSFSGGKDSTVTFNLALQVAREMNRLPLKVVFLDQEAEWQATIDMVREVMENPDVEPLWYQFPFKLFNATSGEEKSQWLNCWDPAEKDKWMRPQESYALTENRYGTDRFGKLFPAMMATDFPNQKLAMLAGMRAEESPTRAMAMTDMLTYEDVTWGKRLSQTHVHYTFYPIYDWSYTDVWKAIHEHGWSYCKLYDWQYQYGIEVRNMRVSNVHHETAVGVLFYMQEVEPETYQRLTQRIGGIDSAGKLGKDDYFIKDLPYMFGSWREYRDYLLEHLVSNQEFKDKMREFFVRQDDIFAADRGENLWRMHINSILTNDWECVKMGNYERSPANFPLLKAWRKRKRV